MSDTSTPPRRVRFHREYATAPIITTPATDPTTIHVTVSGGKLFPLGLVDGTRWPPLPVEPVDAHRRGKKVDVTTHSDPSAHGTEAVHQ